MVALRIYLHGYCISFIIILLIFFSLLSLLVSVFLSLVFAYFFLLSHSSFTLYFNGSDQPLLFNLLQWVWSTSFFLIHSLLVLFVGVNFGLNGSNKPLLQSTLGFCLNGSGFRLRSTMRMRNEKITKLGFERSGFWLDGGWVMMMVVGFEWERERERERERPWVRK